MEADPKLALIARDLVTGIRADLSVDWTSRESTQAAIRRKIKRLLRKHRYEPPLVPGHGGGPGRVMSLDEICIRILLQARVLYAAWPEI